MAEAWRLASPAPPSPPQPPHTSLISSSGQQAFTAITQSPNHGAWPGQGLAQENKAQQSARGGPSSHVLSKPLLSPGPQSAHLYNDTTLDHLALQALPG